MTLTQDLSALANDNIQFMELSTQSIFVQSLNLPLKPHHAVLILTSSDLASYAIIQHDTRQRYHLLRMGIDATRPHDQEHLQQVLQQRLPHLTCQSLQLEQAALPLTCYNYHLPTINRALLASSGHFIKVHYIHLDPQRHPYKSGPYWYKTDLDHFQPGQMITLLSHASAGYQPYIANQLMINVGTVDEMLPLAETLNIDDEKRPLAQVLPVLSSQVIMRDLYEVPLDEDEPLTHD